MQTRSLISGLIALAMVPAEVHANYDWGISKAVPPFDAFWVAPPQSDPGTLLLWHGDEKAGPGTTEEVALNIEDLLKPGGEGSGALPSARSDVACGLKGDAAFVPEGRFGGGIALGGKGAAEGALNLMAAVRENRAATVEFWIWPDRSAGDAVLACFSNAREDLLAIRRSADGRITLTAGDAAVIAHHRPAPAAQWTHIALILLNDGEATLLVNGTAIEAAPKDKAATAKAMAGATGPFRVGAGPDLRDGFHGRLDEIRVSGRERLIYELQDDSWCDSRAERSLAKGPPWFLREAALPAACSFDGTLKPEQFAGVRAEGQADPKCFRPGVRGLAFDLSGVKSNGFALCGLDAFPLDQGSLEFWFRPLDWNNFFHGDFQGLDVPWFRLLSFSQKGCPPYRGLRTLDMAKGRNHADYFGGTPFVPFHPGCWTHVLCTWSPAGSQIYLNGRPQDCGQLNFWRPRSAEDTAEFERWQKTANGKDDGTYRLTFEPSHTLVDELRVYPYALSAREAGNAYARFFPDAPQRMVELPLISLDWQCHYYGKSLTALFACLPVGGVDPAFVDLKLMSADGQTTLWVTNNMPLDNAFRAAVSHDFEPDFGRYPVEVASRSKDGKPLKALKTEYVREKPAWWQNTLGKDRVVPKPWTPIKVRDMNIEVWGRVFTLGAGGLPAGIASAGTETLAGPARIRAQVNGADVDIGRNGDDDENRSRRSGRVDGPAKGPGTEGAGERPIGVRRTRLFHCVAGAGGLGRANPIAHGGFSFEERLRPATYREWRAPEFPPGLGRAYDPGRLRPGVGQQERQSLRWRKGLSSATSAR